MFLLISSLVLFNLSWISKGKEDKVNKETGEYSTESEESVTSPTNHLMLGTAQVLKNKDGTFS